MLWGPSKRWGCLFTSTACTSGFNLIDKGHYMNVQTQREGIPGSNNVQWIPSELIHTCSPLSRSWCLIPNNNNILAHLCIIIMICSYILTFRSFFPIKKSRCLQTFSNTNWTCMVSMIKFHMWLFHTVPTFKCLLRLWVSQSVNARIVAWGSKVSGGVLPRKNIQNYCALLIFSVRFYTCTYNYAAYAHAQQGVKQSVCLSICGHKNRHISRPQLVSTTNQLNLAKNWLQYASNRGTRSTSITNSAFLLPIVATPISDTPIETTAHAWTRLSCACSINWISLAPGLNPSIALAMHTGYMYVLYEL